MTFRLRTILGIAVIEAVLLLILVISSVSLLRSTNEAALHDRAVGMANTFSALAKDAVISSDLATLETFISEVLSQKNVRFVRVRNDDGAVLAEGGETSELTEDFRPYNSLEAIDDGRLDVFAEISEDGRSFGRVELGLSSASIEAIIGQAWKEFAAIASTALVLSAMFSLALGTYLTRKLSVLREIAGKISNRDFSSHMKVKGRDEIAATARAFNEMSANLQSSYRELNDQRRQTKAIVDNVADAIVTFDERCTILTFNAAAETMFGYRAGEIIGRTLSAIIPHFDEADCQDLRRRPAALTGSAAGGGRREVQGRRETGEPITLDLAMSRIEDGTVPRFAAIIRDISDVLESEREMRLAKLVFENSGEAILVTDAGHRVVAVNPQYLKMFGFRLEEFIGQTIDFTRSLGTSDAETGNLLDAIAEAGHWSGEVTSTRANGKKFPRWVTLTGVPDRHGKVANYVSISRDMSEQKRIERMKNEFVATVSHELRTPLTSIKGSLKLVGGGVVGDLPEKAGKLIEIAGRNCDRLILLINDILDTEKIETGSMELNFRALKAGDLLSEAVSACTGFGEERGIRFDVVGDMTSDTILADENRMLQVMANLMSNAAKFSPDGGTVDLRAETAGSRVRISVTDKGSGIPEKFHARLFEKFTQADSSDRRSQGGTGLGLSIAKGIVELHGGTIDFETVDGKGTTFFIDLPVHDERELPAPEAARKEMAS